MISNSAIGQLHQDVELKSDEVQEIISYKPHWMIRKGNVSFLFILLGLIGLTWCIKYPDIIKGSSKLIAINAPKLIVTKTEGRLTKLFISNEQTVRKGQHLAIMESLASYEDILSLQQWIDQTLVNINEENLNTLVINPFPHLAKLGELQSDYAIFIVQHDQARKVLANEYYDKKLTTLQIDLAYLSKLKSNSYEQQQLVAQDHQLQEKEYKAYESLEKDKVIAPLELNEYKSKLLAKMQQVKQLNAQLANADIASLNKQKEILELHKERHELIQSFTAALLQMKGSVEKWLQQYVLTASEDGKVLFVSSIQENQFIASGQALFHIQPVQTRISAEVMVGQKGMGKIKAGQQVHLRVESYPADEYGYLKGTISYITAMPTRTDSFLVSVMLPNGLKTSYNKDLFFRNNLYAQADIITADQRLFHSIIKPLRQVLER
jgi:multidrug resistance efflux pump